CLRSADGAVVCEHRHARGDAAQRVSQIVRHGGSELAEYREMLVLQQRLARLGELTARAHLVADVPRDHQDDSLFRLGTLEADLDDLLPASTPEPAQGARGLLGQPTSFADREAAQVGVRASVVALLGNPYAAGDVVELQPARVLHRERVSADDGE